MFDDHDESKELENIEIDDITISSDGTVLIDGRDSLEFLPDDFIKQAAALKTNYNACNAKNCSAQ